MLREKCLEKGFMTRHKEEKCVETCLVMGNRMVLDEMGRRFRARQNGEPHHLNPSAFVAPGPSPPLHWCAPPLQCPGFCPEEINSRTWRLDSSQRSPVLASRYTVPYAVPYTVPCSDPKLTGHEVPSDFANGQQFCHAPKWNGERMSANTPATSWKPEG